MFLKALLSFLIGGLFCVLAQILIDKTSLTPAKILVLYVVFGVFLGAVGIYNPLFKISGCGVSLPLIGYGANIAKGIRDAVFREGFLGILKGSFEASAVGCTVSLFFGFIISILFKGKSKNL